MKALLIILIPLIILAFTFEGYCQTSKVTWYSFNMAYGEPKSGNTMIKSVVGQAFVGGAQQSNTQIINGFLADTLLTGTVVDVKEQFQIPLSYSLSQNYPNPFNPTTKIRFTIIDSRFTTLKVYNMLGQEMITLVNEDKKAGSYEVEFSASTLPSGVYFYRLSAGTFVEAKKLLLIR